MFDYLRKLFKIKPSIMENQQNIVENRTNRVFTTDFIHLGADHLQIIQNAKQAVFQSPAPIPADHSGMAMDKALVTTMDGFSSQGNYSGSAVVPDALLTWYASQSFIGYQTAAIMAQQWLIAKCCLMPAKDAVRNGYKITVNNGEDIDADILDKMKKADVQFKLNQNLIQFIQMGRIFGIRIAYFIVESDDPEYYYKPFNIDGVTKNSYKGISQIDPYWITPQLDNQAAGNPAAPDFYEPTWWRINGNLIHRTHLIIFRTEEVADILKPTYIYGGIPIPQKIYERVYGAERTTNEAPQLALTKRTGIIKCDVTQGAASPGGFNARAERMAYLRDNYAQLYLGEEEEYNQFDTSLSDLDAVIMTQYQLVAAAANVPATKLLGTQPKGFNSTGEFEEASYHEELKSIQAHDLTPMIERHHMLLIKSEIAPDSPFETSVVWNSLDEMTGKELAELNKLKADTGAVLITSGAIDAEDELNRIIADPESGYDGVEANDDNDKKDVELSDPIDA